MTPPQHDDDPPYLTPEDVQWIRQQRKSDAHEEWLRGQIKIFYPWIIGIATALVAAIVWIRDHVRL